jgi:RimJ/RimL family protein N-acetyltransferase
LARVAAEGVGFLQLAAEQAVRMLIGDVVDDRAVLVAIALFDIDWNEACGEIGYWLAARARGHGIGSTAVSWLTSWALSDLQLTRVIATPDTDNVASQRLLTRCGFATQDDAAPEGARRFYVAAMPGIGAGPA